MLHPAHPELVLMMLADARLPTAGHTQSAGLEPALNGGLRPEEIPEYCRSRLATVTLVEAGVAVVARHRCLTGGRLDEVEDAWAARTASDAMRAASHALGRGYRRLALRLWPDYPALRRVRDAELVSRGVLLGAVAAATGIGAAQLVRLVGYDDVQTVVAAALKLCPFDPAEGGRWVVSAYRDIERMVPPLEHLTEPADIPVPSAPLIEAWAQAHASTTRRLFSA